MQTIEQVQAAWAALDRRAQIEAWDAFTRSIDYGDQGHDPFYLVLQPMWDAGTFPFEDEDIRDSIEELQHTSAADEWFDAMILANDPSDNAFWDRFDPATADAIMGCPL